jgi:hypothetical protein
MIMEGLDRGRIERDHHHLDAVCVHLAKSPIRDVEQPAFRTVRYRSGTNTAES